MSSLRGFEAALCDSQYSHRTGVNFCMLTMLNSKAKVSSLDSIWTASGAIISECTISRR